MKLPVWNVYIKNANKQTIEKYDIFSHSYVCSAVEKMRKEYKKYKKTTLSSTPEETNKLLDKYYNEVYIKSLNSTLMYCFWSKYEYEIGLTSWPVYIDEKEQKRISTLTTTNRELVSLSVYEKVSVYDQLKLNMNVIEKYLWDNYITK